MRSKVHNQAVKLLLKSFCLPLFSIIFLSVLSCQQRKAGDQSADSLSEESMRLVENALKGLHVESGMEVSLFASEPMMKNPTNMDIDSKGRVWIVEGYNYRVKLNPGHPENPAGDRILIMEDLNSDGIADSSKVFYQGTDINSALGIAVLGNKVIVSVSPNVFVFTDTDGDDVADKKELLFTGVGGEQHDHGIHSFTFGPDGKLYFNFGNEGKGLMDKNGNVVKTKEGIPVNGNGQPYRQGMIVRCNIDGSEVEVLGHNFRNNYELAVDAFGSLWQSDNDDDGNRGVRINYVMEYGNYGYTDEKTGASWQTSRVNMEDSIPYRHWHLNDPGVVPNLLQTGAGSPTGIVVYEGNLLPEEFQNEMIHADPLPNVVRSYPVKKQGAGYSAQIVNLLEGSKDKWFRPSDITVAPDGSLFIADWYDPAVGGHQVGDLDRGRVYRLAPKGSEYKIKPLSIKTPSEAVIALESPNIATRYLAWEKLHNWGNSSVEALEKMYSSSNPRFKARALWLLSKLPNNGISYIDRALLDSNEDIRITALRAARQLGVDMAPFVEKVVNDPSAQVRREALVALRFNKSVKDASLWAQLANQYDGKDRWYLEAIGIGADPRWDSFFQAWLSLVRENWNTVAGRDIVWRSRTAAALPKLQQILGDPNLKAMDNLKFFRALDYYPERDRQAVLLALLKNKHPQQNFINAIALLQLPQNNLSKSKLNKQLIDASLLSVKGRPEFIQLIEKYQVNGHSEELLKMTLNGTSEDIRKHALNLLLNTGGSKLLEEKLYTEDSKVASQLIVLLGRTESKNNQELLEKLLLDEGYNSELRTEAAKSLGRNWSGEDRLLALMESGKLPKIADQVSKETLLKAYRPEVRKKAEIYFKVSQTKNTALASIEELSKLTGDAKKGGLVFTNYCNSCHIVGGKGTDFGPNLTEIGDKLAKEALLNAIINPDAGINFGYEGFLIKMKNGKEHLGYISNETPEEVSLKIIGGTTLQLKTKEISSRTAYKNSLMPTGLEKGMTQEQLVDLVSYLSGLKKK